MVSLMITRWLLGFVRFSVSGGSPERFFNACTRSGVYFWNITGRPDCGACVLVSRYRGLRFCARRAGCRLRVTERHGLPFLLYRTRNHRGLFVGAAASVGILLLLSSYVWCIDITGNSRIPTDKIESALRSSGVVPGTPKSQVDSGALAQKLMLTFPEIRWMSVNTQACRLEITLREKEDRPEIQNQSGVCNLKATRTGQIVSLHVYEGTAMVQKGDAVLEGQLLVSAIVKTKSGDVMLRHASAEIIAETFHTFSAEVPFRQRQEMPTGKTAVRRSLDLLGARLPLSLGGKPKGDWKSAGRRTDVNVFGTLLPLSVYEEDLTEIRVSDVTLTKEQARAQADEAIAAQEREFLKNVKILSAQAQETVKDGALFRTAEVRCEENIGQESEILIKSP